MARLGLYTILAIAAATAIVFTIDPELDLRIALFFMHYRSTDAGQWLDTAFAILRSTNMRLTVIVAALPIIAIIVKLAWPKRRMLMPPRAAILMIATLLIGPGLLVNGILKDAWSRPRPGEVTELGGTLAFKPWYDPTGNCPSNCSFVSGESASAFWLLAPATAMPAPWSTPVICGAIVYATAVAFSRVFTTGHFLTDTVFAATLVSLVIWLTCALLYRWTATALSDAAIERQLERCAHAARSPFIAIGNWLVRRSKA